MKIAVLISNTGTGSNLKAIIDGIESGRINADICAVVSDREDALGLEHARAHNIPIEICPTKEDLLPILKN
jgi:phosphoribosylglycinamide formyltransferase-1